MLCAFPPNLVVRDHMPSWRLNPNGKQSPRKRNGFQADFRRISRISRDKGPRKEQEGYSCKGAPEGPVVAATQGFRPGAPGNARTKHPADRGCCVRAMPRSRCGVTHTPLTSEVALVCGILCGVAVGRMARRWCAGTASSVSGAMCITAMALATLPNNF